MDVLDAFAHTVRAYPGGAESLAPRLNMSAAVLRNKADRKKESNKPLLADADNLMAVTADYTILHSLAANHGGVFMQIDPEAPASDMALLELMAAIWRAGGDVGRAVEDTLADGRVEKRELVRVAEAIYRQIQTLKTLQKRLESMAE